MRQVVTKHDGCGKQTDGKLNLAQRVREDLLLREKEKEYVVSQRKSSHKGREVESMLASRKSAHLGIA